MSKQQTSRIVRELGGTQGPLPGGICASVPQPFPRNPPQALSGLSVAAKRINRMLEGPPDGPERERMVKFISIAHLILIREAREASPSG